MSCQKYPVTHLLYTSPLLIPIVVLVDFTVYESASITTSDASVVEPNYNQLKACTADSSNCFEIFVDIL